MYRQVTVNVIQLSQTPSLYLLPSLFGCFGCGSITTFSWPCATECASSRWWNLGSCHNFQ